MIVAVLSLPLVILMTDGFFVSIQIYFPGCQRKEHTEYVIIQYKQPEIKQPLTLRSNSMLFCRAMGEKLESVLECILAKSLRSRSKPTLTRVSRTCPLSPFTHTQSWPNGIPLT